jgi:regulator of PEP synthase PpsR (kinase-PPPase family)
MMHRHGLPWFDVSRIAVEEIAHEVVRPVQQEG